MNALSYGGGRQTAGMLALMKLGELPKTDMILFADTAVELPETYEHVRTVAMPLAKEMGIPFHVVRQEGRYKHSLYDYCWRYKIIPVAFSRMCTEKFKIIPQKRFLSQYKGQDIRQQIGISFDENHRRKIGKAKWLPTEHPLIDNQITTSDCISALKRMGLPVPPKSACYICPFQHSSRWKRTKAQHPDLIDRAIALEEHAQERYPGWYIRGHQRLRDYLEGTQLELPWDDVLEMEAGCLSGNCFV